MRGWRVYPTLPPCGQLTRCFSAVAELLVQHCRVSLQAIVGAAGFSLARLKPAAQ